jgi:hypothetical protein
MHYDASTQSQVKSQVETQVMTQVDTASKGGIFMMSAFGLLYIKNGGGHFEGEL